MLGRNVEWQRLFQRSLNSGWIHRAVFIDLSLRGPQSPLFGCCNGEHIHPRKAKVLVGWHGCHVDGGFLKDLQQRGFWNWPPFTYVWLGHGIDPLLELYLLKCTSEDHFIQMQQYGWLRKLSVSWLNSTLLFDGKGSHSKRKGTDMLSVGHLT